MRSSRLAAPAKSRLRASLISVNGSWVFLPSCAFLSLYDSVLDLPYEFGALEMFPEKCWFFCDRSEQKLALSTIRKPLITDAPRRHPQFLCSGLHRLINPLL